MTLRSCYDYIASDYYRIHPALVRSYCDRKRNASLVFRIFCKLLLRKESFFEVNFWFRLSKCDGLSGRIAQRRYRRVQVKYGVYIPSQTRIGYGLFIGHCVGIVINKGTVIGDNCNISQFLSIGTNHDTPAKIGDNVYLGPHVSIVEDVQIGDNVIVGAGAVVVDDVPCNSTVVGNPGRLVGSNKHPEYIANKWNTDYLEQR